MKYNLTNYRFDQIIPRDTVYNAGIPFRQTAINIVHNSFCKAMVSRGTCTKDCKNCQETLLEAFRGIDPKLAKSPNAVLTWRLRTANMTIIENFVAQQKTEPVSGTGNSFDALEGLFQ